MAADAGRKNPYVGPLPFRREHERRFFGRAREVSDLFSLSFAHKVLLVYAESGAGKSSLLNAGLIPRLERQGFDVLPVARVRGDVPAGVSPANIYVFNTLVSWAGDALDAAALEKKSAAEYLSGRSNGAQQFDAPTLRVAILDQFEEIFTFSPERWKEREGFFQQISGALDQDPYLRVLLVMREDYIARLDPYAPILPERLRSRFRLERLRR